uniref:Uncharacterized protein n=1 Tax=Guillardia theta TaxID=55529 RepID=A0A7S4NE14_GUITH|mmetsp:Transcript_20402/g.68134  ORF Transcript_20402/g.68134 Transcript_20402/m.68134 type:complete len:116 (-) Transcript_20402:63-410(-)
MLRKKSATMNAIMSKTSLCAGCLFSILLTVRCTELCPHGTFADAVTGMPINLLGGCVFALIQPRRALVDRGVPQYLDPSDLEDARLHNSIPSPALLQLAGANLLFSPPSVQSQDG